MYRTAVVCADSDLNDEQNERGENILGGIHRSADVLKHAYQAIECVRNIIHK